MSNIINYIKTNCITKLDCIKCIMAFYHTFKFKSEFQELSETKVFDSYIDNSLKVNQHLLSTIYLNIEDGNIENAIKLFINQIK